MLSYRALFVSKIIFFFMSADCRVIPHLTVTTLRYVHTDGQTDER